MSHLDLDLDLRRPLALLPLGPPLSRRPLVLDLGWRLLELLVLLEDQRVAEDEEGGTSPTWRRGRRCRRGRGRWA